MAKTISVTILVVPTEGKTSTMSTEVKATGATLKEVLEHASIDCVNRDLFVNGKPATLETFIGEKDVVDVKARKVEMKVAERPQGS